MFDKSAMRLRCANKLREAFMLTCDSILLYFESAPVRFWLTSELLLLQNCHKLNTEVISSYRFP